MHFRIIRTGGIKVTETLNQPQTFNIQIIVYNYFWTLNILNIYDGMKNMQCKQIRWINMWQIAISWSFDV